MKTDAEQIQWWVGSPTGIRTRICFEDPSGAHSLTPSIVRERYSAQIRNSALVIWRLPDGGLGGVRAGIDEVTWRDADIDHFVTSFCRPAKGAGHVLLTAQRHDGHTLCIVSSDQYNCAIHEWHLSAAKLVECAYPGLTRIRDDGYDA